MPAHRIGAVPMTSAERQARRRAKLRQPSEATPLSPAHFATAATMGGSGGDQDDYRAWLDNLPANLEASRFADKLQAITGFERQPPLRNPGQPGAGLGLASPLKQLCPKMVSPGAERSEAARNPCTKPLKNGFRARRCAASPE
jgi:hypothetical protein